MTYSESISPLAFTLLPGDRLGANWVGGVAGGLFFTVDESTPQVMAQTFVNGVFGDPTPVYNLSSIIPNPLSTYSVFLEAPCVVAVPGGYVISIVWYINAGAVTYDNLLILVDSEGAVLDTFRPSAYNTSGEPSYLWTNPYEPIWHERSGLLITSWQGSSLPTLAALSVAGGTLTVVDTRDVDALWIKVIDSGALINTWVGSGSPDDGIFVPISAAGFGVESTFAPISGANATPWVELGERFATDKHWVHAGGDSFWVACYDYATPLDRVITLLRQTWNGTSLVLNETRQVQAPSGSHSHDGLLMATSIGSVVGSDYIATRNAVGIGQCLRLFMQGEDPAIQFMRELITSG